MSAQSGSSHASLWLVLLVTACGSSVELASSDAYQQSPPSLNFRGGSDATSLGEVSELAGYLQVDEERVYWDGSDSTGNWDHWLRSCEKQDCAHTLVDYGYSVGQPFGVEKGRVFWLRPDPHFLRCADALVSCGREGCGDGARVISQQLMGGFQFCPTAAVYSADAGYFCWDQMLRRIPLAGDEPELDLAAPLTCRAVAVSAGFVYWLSQSDADNVLSSLWRTAIDGSGSAQLLADHLRIELPAVPPPGYTPQNLAVDSGFVYWSQGDLSGSVVRCPVTGCAGDPEVVTKPTGSPTSILIDGSSLYFQLQTPEGVAEISRVLLPHGMASDPLVTGVAAQSALATDEGYLYTSTSTQTPDANGNWVAPWASLRRVPKIEEAGQ